MLRCLARQHARRAETFVHVARPLKGLPQAIWVEGGAGKPSQSNAEVDAPPWPKGKGFLRSKTGVAEGGMLR